jgi:putative 2-oxoglutarate oxygenase
VLELVPITRNLGTEICGIDITAPISDSDFKRIYQAWIDTTVLLFRGQSITPDQQIAFGRRFGNVVSYTREQFRLGAHPEILVLSNIRQDGKLIGSPVSGRVWHTDGHYLREPPAGSMLYAIEVPPVGGDTWFANMRAAYEELPRVTKERIDDLTVIISRLQSRPYNYPDRPPPSAEEREAWVDVPQPMVLTHPVNGRKAIYAGGNVPWQISGMKEEESAPLVTFVQKFCVRSRFTYRHYWKPGDLILWDNRSAMHKATAYDALTYRRLLHRITIAGLPQTGTLSQAA